MKITASLAIAVMCLMGWAAQGATYTFEGQVEGSEVNTPYLTVRSEKSDCQYPHYCNDKGRLVRLHSTDTTTNQAIIAAMNERLRVRVEGDTLGWAYQEDGWQIYDLNVTNIEK